MPHGGGRLVRMEFMKKVGGRYPVAYGWETWLLYKALELGYDVKNYHEVRYTHLRPYNVKNLFGWGQGDVQPRFPIILRLSQVPHQLRLREQGNAIKKG